MASPWAKDLQEFRKSIAVLGFHDDMPEGEAFFDVS